jgi:hypothetical protein
MAERWCKYVPTGRGESTSNDLQFDPVIAISYRFTRSGQRLKMVDAGKIPFTSHPQRVNPDTYYSNGLKPAPVNVHSTLYPCTIMAPTRMT